MGKNKKVKPKKINVMYDEAERKLLERLSEKTLTTEELSAELRNLKMLEEARAAKPTNKVSADNAAKCGTSFFALLTTLMFEAGPNPHIIKTKGFNLIPKIKF